jgi:anti-sigma factor RsiW
MACNPEEILLYIEGELGPEEAARVRAHTAACAACRELLLSEQALDSALGGLRDLEPPPDFASDTVRRAQCDVTACVFSPGERRRAALIAVALASLSVLLLWPTGAFASVLQTLAPARCMARFACNWLQSTGLTAFVVARTLSRSFLQVSSLSLGGGVAFFAVLVVLLAWLIAGYRRQDDHGDRVA